MPEHTDAGTPTDNGIDPYRGVYDARRAAALSGVPETTLHYWARNRIYVPSISPDPRTRYWSWFDLVVLRAIDWLRRPIPEEGKPAVSIPRIRVAMAQLQERQIPLSELGNVVLVTRTTKGRVLLDLGDAVLRAEPGGQVAFRSLLELARPYNTAPDLLSPRPRLRIIPGKLHGEPHLANTRIPSAAVYALYQNGYRIDQIHKFYPEADPEALREAVELEHSLAQAA